MGTGSHCQVIGEDKETGGTDRGDNKNHLRTWKVGPKRFVVKCVSKIFRFFSDVADANSIYRIFIGVKSPQLSNDFRPFIEVSFNKNMLKHNKKTLLTSRRAGSLWPVTWARFFYKKVAIYGRCTRCCDTPGCGMPGVSKMTTWVGKFESIFQW